MTVSENSAGVAEQKLLGATAIKVRIALASGLVLVLGAWLAPRATPTALTAPQERAAPLLEEQVQLREVAQPFAGIQDAAKRLPADVVEIPAEAPPASTSTDFSAAPGARQADGLGTFVSDRYLLTHAAALNGRSSAPLLIADGRSIPASVVAYEPATGLVLMEAEASNPSTGVIAVMAPQTGALAIAAGRQDGRPVAVPVFITNVGTDRYTVGALDGALRPGMPIYTLEGQLLAVASGGVHGHAYAARAAADRLMARAAAGARPVSFGLALQDVRGALTRVFGEAGAVVSHVVSNGPADLAGVRVGDVILAIGDVEVQSADAAARTLSAIDAESVATVRVRRAGRPRTFEITPAPQYDVDGLARAAAEDAVPGPAARLLFAPATLDRAGIPPLARVLAINGRRISTREEAERELRRVATVPVLLFHGDERFFAVIEPAP